jgi:hypothetical protein
LSSSFSISAWFLPWGIVSPSQIISKWDNNGNQVFRLYIQNFELGAAINNGISSEVVESNSCSICTDGSWYHIVLTFQYPNLVTLFVNGNLSQTTILQNSGLNNAQIPITIGDSFSYPFDDIALYDRAITPEEITALYTGEPLIPTNINRPLSDNTNNIKVFPNPTGSNLTIDIGNFALMNGYQLRVKNSLGQQVFQTNINQESETLTLNNWGGNGLYFVHVIDPQGNTIDIRKIVLQ